METSDLRLALSPEDDEALSRAVDALEKTSFAMRLADYAGRPIAGALQRLPVSATRTVERGVQQAVLKALEIAISTLDENPAAKPAVLRSDIVAGVTGGVGGLFGLWSLPIELPLTTTVILRAIADIARYEGEDLGRVEGRLACLEVFALAANGRREPIDLGYFVARAMLAKLTAAAAAAVVERGVTGVAGPVVNGLVSAVVARFSVVVSDRLAASALPVIGGLGGAAVNLIFMRHFQEVASAHFAVRRLERAYGPAAVKSRYLQLAGRMRSAGAP